ncbi:MAG: MiaB/RimO family radical SAM methylthiotransferase [Chloroflexi bacterium]|nr:MiaB/RimO family radical SAM methylthiotransferase [Chloroflexota bacterium]
MNRAESLRLSARLFEMGYTRAFRPEQADVILLNTCVVRQNAEDKAVNKLQNLKALKKKYPEKTIALSGCLVESVETTKERFPFVDVIFKAGDWPQDWLKSVYPSLPLKANISEAVTIMQGCNQFCTYCIVPYRRGREHSRTIEDIENEVRVLVARGALEIVLLGQNVDAYGQNLKPRVTLADLLCKLNKIEGLKRLRFLTSHPKDVDDKLIATMASLDKVCHQISLPSQSGDNEILQKMRRGYTIEQYWTVICKLKEAMPDIALSNDIIVGFPGESLKAYQNSYEHIRNGRFDTVHIAAYSTRSGTIAARTMTDDVLTKEKERRLKELENLQQNISQEINQSLVDSTQEVLFTELKNNKWQGRTKNDKLVFVNCDGNLIGQTRMIHITWSGAWSLSGKIV